MVNYFLHNFFGLRLIFFSADHPLLDHQETCVEFVLPLLRNTDFMGALNCDEMGMGKTGE